MAANAEKTQHADEQPSDMAIERQETGVGGNAGAKEASMEAAARGQGVSGYETLSLWQTIKAFKVCTAYCFLVAFSAATDGYQIG